MRTRGAAIQGGLAALGLLAAYGTWQREPERATGEIVVMDNAKSDLTKLRYEEGDKWVELEQRTEPGADGPAVWLKVSPNDKAKTPLRELRGNESAQLLWGRFTPLRSLRALGLLDAAKLKELGLDAPKKKIEITTRRGTRVFLVGASPFNVSDPYMQDEADKRVYVWSGTSQSDFENAAVRLVDRTLHEFKSGDFDALTIAAGGKTRELVVLPGETPLATKLASKTTPDRADEQAKNWHDKLFRLFPTEVLGKGEAPASGAPEVLAKVEYRQKGKTKGFVELAKVPPAAPPPQAAASSPQPPPPAPEYYARTEHTAGWLKLPASADDLVKELDKIVSAE